MQPPLYVSPRTWRSLGQRYWIFPDRLELQCWVALGRRLVVPLEDIRSLEVRPPIVVGDLFRCKGVGYAFPLKMDWADLSRHVALRRQSGWFKHVRFTPDDPAKFVEVCRARLGHTSDS